MKKTAVLILIILLLGGVYYVWNHRYDYFFKGEDLNVSDDKAEETETEDQDVSQDSVQPDSSATSEEGVEEKNQDNPGLKKKSLEEIIANDCERNCENKKGEEDYQYCLEICGLKETSAFGNCEELSGLEKESCYKNEAISKKSFELCDKISDSNLEEACKNRVSEEIIDSAGE